MNARPLWLLLALLGPSACLVPGLEIGPGQDGAAGTTVGGTGSALVGGAGGALVGGAGGTLGGAAGGALVGGTGSGGSGSVGTGDSGSTGSGGAPTQAGAGGSATVEVRCEDLPIPPKSTWTAIASSTSLGSTDPTDPLYNPASNAIDGSMADRWASGQPQASEGQWFHIDFGTTVAISEVTLEQGTNLQDYPRGYEISLSYRHTDFDAVASAKGAGASVSETVIPLVKRSVGRYMLIRQTGTADRWWSIAEVNVACH